MKLIHSIAVIVAMTGLSTAGAYAANSTVSGAAKSTLDTAANGAAAVNVDAGAGAGASGGTDTSASGALGADVSANAQTDGSTAGTIDNYGGLISSLQTHANADLSAVASSSNVSFVLVSSLKGGADAKALTNALDKNASAQAKLHAELSANATLSTKISKAGYSVDQVVAVTTAVDGSVTLYVDDRA